MVVITDIIRHEILVGTNNRREFQNMEESLSPLECLRIRDEDIPSFDQFSWSLHRKGLKGKYTDLSIAFLSAHHQIPLLSFDGYFKLLSRRGVIKTIVT
jgi:predicted nucleic acid-binding protein